MTCPDDIFGRYNLIAYGREFVQPRPYTLGDLAAAAGMSISGTRTAYGHHGVGVGVGVGVGAVATATGARPHEWRTPEATDDKASA
ncbi:hypothetical protein [Polymorphospora sp. NPDC050346]|uniref:hypothetical protein n=1 Tax=Polymorphospora sp. NPDC050346 TaxID=3155780 RepID=UPI0033FFAEFF